LFGKWYKNQIEGLMRNILNWEVVEAPTVKEIDR